MSITTDPTTDEIAAATAPDPDELASAIAAHEAACGERQRLDALLESGDNEAVTVAAILAADKAVGDTAELLRATREISERRRDVAAEAAAAASLAEQWSEVSDFVTSGQASISKAHAAAVRAIAALVERTLEFNAESNRRRDRLTVSANETGLIRFVDGRPEATSKVVAGIDYPALNDVIHGTINSVPLERVVMSAVYDGARKSGVPITASPLSGDLSNPPSTSKADGTLDQLERQAHAARRLAA